jgi:hypothetical protein
MSGSFERLAYDHGAYCADLKQSTAPLLYLLDPSYANPCQPCRPADIGYLGRQGVSLAKNIDLVDLESSLKLLNYRNSRDPNAKFNPCCEGDYSQDLLHFDECMISTDYSRVTNPPCTLRGTGVNRFQPLCLNPQDPDRWEYPAQIGINYRLVVKDNFVPVVPDVTSFTKTNPDSDPIYPRPGPNCLPTFTLTKLCHPMYA